MITIYVCAEDAFKGKQGIHLSCPDTWYLERALEDAEKDMFDAVYAHYPSSGRIFQVHATCLELLFQLATRRKHFSVVVIDPAHTETSFENLQALRKAGGK